MRRLSNRFPFGTLSVRNLKKNVVSKNTSVNEAQRRALILVAVVLVNLDRVVMATVTVAF